MPYSGREYLNPHLQIIDRFALAGFAARVKPSPAVATLQEETRKILWPQREKAPRAVAPHRTGLTPLLLLLMQIVVGTTAQS